MNFYITGDKHGDFTSILKNSGLVQNSENAIIILGDAGLNFYLNKTDEHKKHFLTNNSQCYWYIVRGNHEARPQSIPGMKFIYDRDNVDGPVWMEEQFPRIRYFLDYGEYWINHHHTLVLGGAYSVDKFYRLARAVNMTELNNNPKASGWFNDEQLSEGERASAKYIFQYDSFDFVLTHTCPIDWVPNDLFIDSVSQESVDTSMEKWLMDMRSIINWGVWCFGHYHADRIERPRVEQFYNDSDCMETIWKRWKL